MDLPRVGSKLGHETSSARVIVVKVPDAPGLRLETADDDKALVLGKRYTCSICPAEVLVLQPGTVVALCHDQPMSMAAPKSLPASD